MAAIFSKIDLHTHSNASDGGLTPTQLVERAYSRGLTHIALTDHDTTLGIKEAKEAAMGKIQLIEGCELSTTFNNNQIHIVGLFIDPNAPSIQSYIQDQKQRRIERAKAIGAKLEKQGFANAYEECKKLASEDATITRGNYAAYIAKMGRAQDVNDAFDSYLKKGKSCYVKTLWPDIKVAVEAIQNAGGVAVLAHPNRYQLTNTRRRELISYFKACGGDAMEVCNSQINATDYDLLNKLCLEYQLLASFGSDFHQEGTYRELGLNLRLEDCVKPVWTCPQALKYHFE